MNWNQVLSWYLTSWSAAELNYHIDIFANILTVYENPAGLSKESEMVPL